HLVQEYRNQDPVYQAVEFAAKLVAETVVQVVAVFDDAGDFGDDARSAFAEAEGEARYQHRLADRIACAEGDVVAMQQPEVDRIVEANGQCLLAGQHQRTSPQASGQCTHHDPPVADHQGNSLRTIPASFAESKSATTF